MKKIIAWVEIPAVEIERAVKFYNALLDLDLEILDFGEEKMACFPNDEGAISVSAGFKPSKDGVLVSFNMGLKLEQAIGKVSSMGGVVIQPKTKIDAEDRGSFALFIDTEGNKVGLYGND